MITLITIAVVAWLLFAYVIPMLPDPIRTIAIIIVAIAIIVYLLRLMGINF